VRHGIKKWIVSAVAAGACAGLDAATQLGGASGLPAVITETLPTQSPAQTVPLIIHRMPSTPSPVASRNQRYMFSDETLLPPNSSVGEEFAWCVNAGAVAVVQDSMTEESVQAAREAGLDLILLPNMSPMRMVWYGASADDPASVARYWVKMIQETEQWSDVLLHQNGRPVMWLFSATKVPASFYTDVRRIVREMGYDPVMIYHAQLRRGHRSEEEVEPYLRIFDGALVWGDGYDTIKEMVELVVPVRDRIEQETGERKQVILTTKPGHWRPESGLLIDGHGTKEFRHTIDLAYQYKLDGLNIESWNDFSENHHVQPSVAKSTVLSDLCTYYGKLGTGQPSTVEYPGLYISHRRDIVAGEYMECEVLYLPVATNEIREVRLILKSKNGSVLYSSKPWKIKPSEAGAKTFNVPTFGMNAPETILPVLEINGVAQSTSTFCDVNASRSPNPFGMHMSMAKALPLQTADFSIDEQSGRANIHVKSDRKISRIEIVQDGRPVWSAGFEKVMQDASPSNEVQTVGFYWDIPGSIPSLKDEPKSGMDFGGQISVSNGVAVEAIHAKYAEAVLESSSLAKWNSDTCRPHDGVDVVFSGDSNTQFNVSFPGQSFDASIRWGDVMVNGFIELPMLSHSRLIVRPMPRLTGHPVPLGVTEYQGAAELPVDDAPARRSYVLRVIAEDGSIWRSAPVEVSPGTEAPVRTWLWDASQAARFEKTVPADSICDVTWSLDGIQRRIPDANGLGYFLELGGLFERDGRFNPDQIPERVKDRKTVALKFDGNDVALTQPQLVPSGSCQVSFKIKPEGMGSEQVLMEVPEAITMVLQADGHIRIWYGDREANVRLLGRTELPEDRWTQVTFIYDLNEARLMIDGEEDAFAEVAGLRDRITQKAAFGASVAGGHMKRASRGFDGQMKDIILSVDADEMDALRPERVPPPKWIVTPVFTELFEGKGNVPIIGKARASKGWQGIESGAQWMANGAITSSADQSRYVFRPFVPRSGKIYRLTAEVERIGKDFRFDLGFTSSLPAEGDSFTKNRELAAPWVRFQAYTGEVGTHLGPGPQNQTLMKGPNPRTSHTLEIILDTTGSKWAASWFLDGSCIREPVFYKNNPVIRYVGFGRYRSGTFVVSRFEYSEVEIEKEEE
jgi:hypothetical protein